MKSNFTMMRQKGAGLGWKSYIDDLLNELTRWCKLPHIIMGIPSKEPEWVWPTLILGTVKTCPFTVTLCKTLRILATKVTTNNNKSWGNNQQSNPHTRAGYLARNQLERLPLIIVGIPSSDPYNMCNLYTDINKSG
jgi:hypothetical protein